MMSNGNGSARQHGHGHGRGKRILRVRAMAREIDWLAATPALRDATIAWIDSRGSTVPGGADLALAQRRLNQIARYPLSAAQALGDLPGWLAEQRQRLAVARALLACRPIELSTLAERARRGDPGAIADLASLLGLEALTEEPLDPAPSILLARSGSCAVAACLNVRDNADLPEVVRVLAALVIGAISRDGIGKRLRASNARGDWLDRAQAWALRHGLPETPVPIALLLRAPEGVSLVARYRATLAAVPPFTLPVPSARRLLRDGMAPALVVDLAEAVQAAGDVVERIIDYRGLLLEIPPGAPQGAVAQLLVERQRQAETLRARRVQAVEELAAMLLACAECTRDISAVRAFITFVHAMLDLAVAASAPPTPRRARKARRSAAQDPDAAAPLDAALVTTFTILRQVAKLSPGRHVDCLMLLQQKHAAIFAPHLECAASSDLAQPRVFAQWLERRRIAVVRPLRMLLEQGIAMPVLRAALEHQVLDKLSRFEWCDPALCGWAMTLIQQFNRRSDAHVGSQEVWFICDLLSGFANLDEARRVASPFFSSLQAGPPEAWQQMLRELGSGLDASVAGSRRIVLLTPFIPILLRWVTAEQRDQDLCADLARCAIALAEAHPDIAVAWFGALLDYLRSHVPPAERSQDEGWLLFPVVSFSIQLASADYSRFEILLDSLLTHARGDDATVISKSLSIVRRSPAFGLLLGAALPRQPRRCLDLLGRLAQVIEPGMTWPPLDSLQCLLDAQSLDFPADWRPLLRLQPDMAPVATTYLAARQLLSGSARLPVAVRRALTLPARLAAEHAYLEQQAPLAPKLVARLDGLRRRRQDAGALLATVREEAGEHMRQAACLAQIEAIEHIVRECERERLRRVVGSLATLPAPVENGLVAATPYLSGVRANRGLLRRLLRSCALDDPGAMARHPANVAFLEQLAAGGVDAAAWLDAHHERAALTTVSGGRIHLGLERDPLAVLQMGSYFDTCLGPRGGNAHAAVANACELNKRVLYVRDARGKVIARKLIGISESEELIGYHLYSHVSGEDATILQTLVDDYLRRFAVACGLRRSDVGTVGRLFAASWYDDGAVPWSAVPSTAAQSARRVS
jgi:hypothetical protein